MQAIITEINEKDWCCYYIQLGVQDCCLSIWTTDPTSVAYGAVKSDAMCSACEMAVVQMQ